MIEVTEAFKKAWLNGRQKHIQLNFSDNSTLGDEDVVLESMTIEQSLCEEEQITFGLTASAKFSIQIMNAGKKYQGLSVTPLVGAVDENNHYYTMELGTYRIAEDVRSEDRVYRSLVAYDALYDVLNTDYTDFYNAYFTSNPYPTLKQFRDAFFTYIGIQQVTTTLPFDNLNLVRKAEVSGLSGSEIICQICEPNATFGFVNYEGKFQYKIFDFKGARHYPANDLYPSGRLYPGEGADLTLLANGGDTDEAPTSVVYSDYYCHKITQAKFNSTANTADVVVGTTGNCYTFRESTVLYGQTESVLRSIATKFLDMVSEFFYNPSTIVARTRLWVQLGDVVDVATKDGGVKVPILKRTIAGITAMSDTYEAKGKEYLIYSPNSQSEIIADFENYKEENRVELKKLEDQIYASVGKTMDVWDEGNLSISAYGFGIPEVNEYDSITWDTTVTISGEEQPFPFDYEEYGAPLVFGYSMDDVGNYYFDLTNGDSYMLTYDEIVGSLWWEFVGTGDMNFPGTQDGDYTVDDAGTLYLDEDTGKVYELQTYTRQVGLHSGHTHTVTGVKWVYSQQLGTTKAYLESKIAIEAGRITSEVTQRQSSDSALSSRIEQTAKSISFSLSQYGDTGAQLSMSYTKEDGTVVNVSAQHITLTGLVTFTDLSTSGSTTINGANIQTGTLSCSKLNGGTISGQSISGGTISGSSISGGIIRGTTISGVTFTGQDVDFEYIDCSNDLDVSGDIDVGDTLYTDTIDPHGTLAVRGAISSESSITAYSSINAGSNVNATSGTVNAYQLNQSYLTTISEDANVRITNSGNIRRISSGSSRRWKHDITDELDEDLNPDKLYDLDVVQFKFNTDYLEDRYDHRYNTDLIGFIAEDVSEVYPVACDYDELNMPSGWNSRYMIPAMLKLIQEQHAEIEALKQRVSALENN